MAEAADRWKLLLDELLVHVPDIYRDQYRTGITDATEDDLYRRYMDGYYSGLNDATCYRDHAD